MLGDLRMYSALTGYVGGFAAAFTLHSFVVGHFALELLWVAALLVVFLLLIAVDAETLFLSRWGREIARRRAAGILSWRFCATLGAVFGATVYPVVALAWHLFPGDQARGHSMIGIALIVVSVGAALFLVWYLLTRYPRSNDVT
jgi:hypothetical protein